MGTLEITKVDMDRVDHVSNVHAMTTLIQMLLATATGY